jgi:hypothetical protein
MLTLLSLFVAVTADEMRFVNPHSSEEFSWSSLQQNNPYSIDSESELIEISIGASLEQPCNAQFGSIIRFNKDSATCEILGQHDHSSVFPNTRLEKQSLTVFYEEGDWCVSPVQGNIRRKTELRFVCSSLELEFQLKESTDPCTTVIQKFTEAGCPRIGKNSVWIKLLFVG